MSCRLNFHVSELLLNQQPVRDLTCSVSIHECAEVRKYSCIPFQEKLVFDLPNFEGLMIINFQLQGKNFATTSVHLKQLFDRNTTRLDVKTFGEEPDKQLQNITLKATVQAIQKQNQQLQGGASSINNMFEEESLVKSQTSLTPGDKTGVLTIINKEFGSAEVKYQEKNIFETVKSNPIENSCSIELRQEILKLHKSLNEKGEVLHQKRHFEEKQTTKSSNSYVPLLERQYESIVELNEADTIIESKDNYSESQYSEAPIKFVSPTNSLVKNTVGYTTEYSSKGEIIQRKPFSDQRLVSPSEITRVNEISNSTGLYEDLSMDQFFTSKKQQAESLIDILEQKLKDRKSSATPDIFSTLKSVVDEMASYKPQMHRRFSSNPSPLMKSSLTLPLNSMNATGVSTSNNRIQQTTAHLQFQQPYSHHYHPANSQQNHYNVTNPSMQQSQSRQTNIQPNSSFQNTSSGSQQIASKYIPKQEFREPKSQTAPVNPSSVADHSLNRRAQTMDDKTKKKKKKDVNPNEYLLDLGKSLHLAATVHIAEIMPKDIIFQMSRSKKELVPIKIQGPIRSEEQEIKVNVKNYFMESCNRKYIHYFMPYTKNLFLLNLDKKIEDPAKKDVFQKIDLEIEFDLSPHLRSLITPTGLIFLVGGKAEATSTTLDDSIGTCHLYHYDSQTLVEKSTMSSFKRRNFGLIYFNKNLFVIGGVVQGQLSTGCERYDIRSNEWVPIASMEKAVEEPSLCIFGNRYIFRFFGINSKGLIDQTVERFDAIRNRWQTMKVDVKASMRDTYLPLCCQISPEHVFIFGGRNTKGVEASKGYAYIVKLEEKKASQNMQILKASNPLSKSDGVLNPNSLFVENNTIITVREGTL